MGRYRGGTTLRMALAMAVIDFGESHSFLRRDVTDTLVVLALVS